MHSCQLDDSALIDIASLAEVEFLVNLLGDGKWQKPLINIGMRYNVVTIFISGVEKKLSYLKVILSGTYI